MSDQSWDRRPPATSNRERDEQLVAWLTGEVIPFSGFWGERLAGLKFRGVESLGGVPVTDESELTGAGGPGNPRLLLLPTEDQFKRHASRGELVAAARELRGGSEAARRAVLYRRYKPVHVHEAGVATVLAIAYTRTDLDRLHLAGARLCEVLGLGADDAMVNAVPAGPSIRFWGLYHAALGARMTALHPRSEGRDPVLAVARALALLPATVLAVPVDEAEVLITALVQRGVHAPRLRTVLTVGPGPTAEQRGRIVDAAGELGAVDGVRVQAVWAPEASRTLWGECRPPSADPDEATYGFHTYPDMEVLEVRDPADGLTVPDEQPGELLLTSLGWRGTALVRAATGTWTAGVVNHVSCPNCRRTVPRLAPESVAGAWQPRVQMRSGRMRRVDLRRAGSVLEPRRLAGIGVRDWSLRPMDGRLVLSLAVDPGIDPTPLGVELGGVIGVVPDVRVDPAAAALRPQVGAAGPEHARSAGPAAVAGPAPVAEPEWAQEPPPVDRPVREEAAASDEPGDDVPAADDIPAAENGPARADGPDPDDLERDEDEDEDEAAVDEGAVGGESAIEADSRPQSASRPGAPDAGEEHEDDWIRAWRPGEG